jgi:hypothetical protein
MKLTNVPVCQSTDFMYTTNTTGLSLLKFKGKVCMTVYEDTVYQIFHTEDMNGVYYKAEEKVYQLSIDSWTRMVLKIESITTPFDPHSSIWR